MTRIGSKIFSNEEVNEHNTEGDCWIIIGDIVYDVTEFLGQHPAGSGIILKYAGKDCTDDFKAIGHSKNAHELLREYKIGELKTDS
jgi:cytochrome b involved in lipid metabolism